VIAFEGHRRKNKPHRQRRDGMSNCINILLKVQKNKAKSISSAVLDYFTM
jgi:hypothetical protein